jgi:hypothetical protein
MTEQEYIFMRGEREAQDILENHLHPFSDVIECFLPNNMARKEFNKLLKEMGYEKPRATKKEKQK